MSAPRSPVVALLMLAVCLSAGALAARAQEERVPDTPLAQGDHFWQRESFAPALEAYQKALSDRSVPAERRPQVEYRIAVALGRTERWNEAVGAAERFARQHPDTIWEARARYWQMRLYLGLPKRGWRVGERLHFGEDEPLEQDDFVPELANVSEENAKQALAYGERAKAVYEQLRAAGTDDFIREEIDLCLDLAYVVQLTDLAAWVAGEKWGGPGDARYEPRPDARYDPSGPPPQRILSLLLQAEDLSPDDIRGHVRILRAAWLRAYIMRMRQRRMFSTADKRTFAYENAKPTALLEAVVRDDENAAAARLALALSIQWHKLDRDYLQAAEAARAMLEVFPDGRWTKFARETLADIVSPVLVLTPPRLENARPNTPALLSLRAANVEKAELRAWRIPLPQLLRSAKVLGRLDANLDYAINTLGGLERLKEGLGEPVASWTATDISGPKHEWRRTEIATPFTEPGCYLIVAEGGGIRSETLFTISDLAVIQWETKDRISVRVLDADSGVPIAGANVVIREIVETGKSRKLSAVTTTTDDEGMAGKRLVGEDSTFQSFAWVDERLAVAPVGWSSSAEDPQDFRAFVYTDRTLYRPGQEVRFRVLVAQRADSQWRPAPDLPVVLIAESAYGEERQRLRLRTDRYGAAHGQIVLPVGAQLGNWSLTVSRAALPGAEWLGDGEFRVEEYRRPEFRVQVVPLTPSPSPGQPMRALVTARYYFGGPVQRGRVTYVVSRSRGGTELASGEGQTDDKGEFTIEVDDLTEGDTRYARSFQVQATVIDPSRRAVTGAVEITVPSQRWRATVRFPVGFSTIGDGVPEVEIRLMGPGNKPISAAGEILIERYVAANPYGDRNVLIERRNVRTDADGRTVVRWSATRGGRYRLTFQGRQSNGRRFRAREEIWLAGDGLEESVEAGDSLRLVPRGGNADASGRVLVISPESDLHLVFDPPVRLEDTPRRLVHFSGHWAIVSVPAPPDAVGEINVRAVGIKRYRTLTARATVGFAAEGPSLRVRLIPDDQEYAPGATATVQIIATRPDGEPARVQFSLGVVDTSLQQLQSAFMPPQTLADYFSGEVAEGVRFTTSSRFQFARRGNLPTEIVFETSPEWPLQPVGRLRQWPGNGSDHWLEWAAVWHPAELRGGGMSGSFGISPAPGFGLGISTDAESTLAESARSNFQETAYWNPAIETDENGRATVSFTWPDDLTTWQAKAIGWTADGIPGEAEIEIVTRKDFLVRLQAPRFFLERDATTISAVVHNYRDQDQIAEVTLDLGGDLLRLDPEGSDLPLPGVDGDPLRRRVLVRARSEKRLDWPVRVLKPGAVTLRVTAKTDIDSDGVERVIPSLAHGVEKEITRSGVLREQGRAEIKLVVPAARHPGSGELVVSLSPSAASALMDALPYLVDYPYGCVEQTLSRFLPAVQVSQSLKTMGVDLAELAGRAEARYLALTNRSVTRPFPDSPYSYDPASAGHRAALLRAQERWRWRADRDPVTDPERLRELVKEGLDRLADFQHSDGGWGWWKEDASDATMTAHVVYGLMQARAAGVTVPPKMLSRGFDYLAGVFKRERSYQQLAYYGFVLSLSQKHRPAVLGKLKAVVYANRAELSPYSMALLALAMRRMQRLDLAEVVVENLANFAREDEAAGTLHFRREVGRRGAWYNDLVEANATILKLYIETAPDSPTVDKLARWLIRQRNGQAWSSTRQTAIALGVLATYARLRQELNTDCTVTVAYGEGAKRTLRFTPENALWADTEFVVPDALLGEGETTLTIQREGRGTVYYTARLRYFTREEGIIGASSGIRVQRRLFRLYADPESGRTRRHEIFAGDAIRSGDVLEVALHVRSDGQYDYLVIEDPKPAGCEPIALRSGSTYANGFCANLELRDHKTVFFVTRMPFGARVIRYQLRAETPGRYHALPTLAYAMYAPGVRSLSDEFFVNISRARP